MIGKEVLWEMKKDLSMGRGEHGFKKEMRISHYPLCYAKISHSCEIPDREHGFANLSQKWIRIWFAYGSHSCEIRIRDFGKGPRACFFGNWSSSTRRPWVLFEENLAWMLGLVFWIGEYKAEIGWGLDLECWVRNWEVFDGGKSWKLKGWTVMNSDCRGYEVKLWRWAAMVVLRLMNDDEKKLKEGIWWSEERCYEKWRRNWAWEEENTVFKKEMQISHYPLCYAKISHSCEIPDREHGFFKFASKTNSHMVRIPVKFA